MIVNPFIYLKSFFQKIRYRMNVRRVSIPAFKIVNNTIIQLSEIKQRRFSIIDRKPILGMGNSSRTSIFHQRPYERFDADEILFETISKMSA